MTSLFIDQREPASVVSSLQAKFHPTLVTMLDCGDVWIAADDGNLVVIERKTPEDLLQTLRSDNPRDLFLQVSKMLNKSQWCYLVITGILYPGQNGKISLPNRDTKWNFDSVMGALLTVQEMGCNVIYTKNEFDYPDCIDRLAKRSREVVRVGAQRTSSILSVGEQLLLSLPGIGFDRLKKLLEFRPRPIDAFFYLLDKERQTIPGISLALKHTIRKELGLKDEEIALLTSTLDFEFIEEKERILTNE